MSGGRWHRWVVTSSPLAGLSSFNLTPAEARSKTPNGAGASTCRDFAEIFDAFRPFIKETAHDAVAQRATANYLQYEEWIEGYLFGMGTNIHSGGVLRDWDEVGMREWIYGFCQKHPSEIVANAALAFFEMLSGAPDAR